MGGTGVMTEADATETLGDSEALATLHRVFGYDAFRGEQEAIIEHVVAGGDAVVLMPTFLMNRDDRFFADPLRFDPERFAPEAVARRPRHAYLLFGGGPRQCIGNAFALIEGVLVASVIAQRWRLRLPAGHDVVGEAAVTLRPKGGLPMILERRAA